MADVMIARGPAPEAAARIVDLHATYYAEHWGFGAYFENKVASDLAGFLARYESSRDGLWLARVAGEIEGAIAIDGIRAGQEGAHLRWFIVSELCQGRGIGGELLRAAMDFCRARAYPRVHLWTFAGLDAARHLYEKESFVLVEQRAGSQWGSQVLEQRWECRLVHVRPGASAEQRDEEER